ncbi:O-antigen ligase family protein [Bradyrhizobium sp. WSM471]|uniref:O-antigen ligase family protein n=1 Tax=Bradyrhizobium sp. WSM471 TaxID=319017 RepID=UPI00024D2C26|nr:MULTISPECIES: O-antigen ligase family protein [Bradyrhizobium]EHR04625.1 lipid A core-O-antigen ligase-like enyme [Bradyrhizobium sp. WSM471]UFW39773.1 O-antigen ligase family protein [Bradyrhizobium canariense]
MVSKVDVSRPSNKLPSMSADPASSSPEMRPSLLHGSRVRTDMADYVAFLLAASLPWSTSLVSILVVVWLITTAPTIDFGTFIRSLGRPVCALPIALFVLAVVGTLWSDAPWGTRLYYIGPNAKLLVLPLLIYHFERSRHGRRVFIAFLASCTALLMVSWLSYLNPPFVYNVARQIGFPFKVYIIGVPVKNYISQSQEFVLCAFGLAIAAQNLWAAHHRKTAIAAIALGFAFLTDLLVVISARTAFVSIPLLLAILLIRHVSRRKCVALVVTAGVAIAVLWTVSPYLRARMENAVTEYSKYTNDNQTTSSGERLEYWRKSVKFFLMSPFIGHGTGSIRGLFERDAVGRTGVSAEVVENPHNQTFYFAIQWGVVGVGLLYAMWIVHFSIFRHDQWIAWLGTILVVQNIVGSIFNSHISDFVEGWIYVIGVGVAGGMSIKFDADAKESREVSAPLSEMRASP